MTIDHDAWPSGEIDDGVHRCAKCGRRITLFGWRWRHIVDGVVAS